METAMNELGQTTATDKKKPRGTVVSRQDLVALQRIHTMLSQLTQKQRGFVLNDLAGSWNADGSRVAE